MDSQINIREVLDWYVWAGVTDTFADSVCLNNDVEIKNLEQPLQKNIDNNNVSSKSLVNFDNISQNAKDLCQNITSLEQLKKAIQNFDGCHLKTTAVSTILGEGSENAKIVLIGEAPGGEEDKLGRPFVGRCGILLDKMLSSIKLKREECYITNVVQWRPPGNRTPTDEEIAICLPFLKKQLDLIQPDYILLLGGIALKSLMDVNDSVSRSRGKWLEYTLSNGKKVSVLTTFHPSYLLRSSVQKSKVWADLLRLKKKISE